MQIGADLVTNLIMLNPHLITLHDTELIQLDDCYSTYRTPPPTQTTPRIKLTRRVGPTT